MASALRTTCNVAQVMFKTAHNALEQVSRCACCRFCRTEMAVGNDDLVNNWRGAKRIADKDGDSFLPRLGPG